MQNYANRFTEKNCIFQYTKIVGHTGKLLKNIFKLEIYRFSIVQHDCQDINMKYDTQAVNMHKHDRNIHKKMIQKSTR